MKRGSFTNRELDELGKRLVTAVAPDEGEIDRLVSNPSLYDGVLARIAAVAEPVREPRRRFGLKPVAVMAMAAALLSIPILALLKYTGVNKPVVTKEQPRPLEVKEKPFVRDIPRQPKDTVEAEEPRPIRAVLKKTLEPQQQSPPRKARKARTEPLTEPDPVFHPIGLADRAEEAAIDGRVVRVEMPRSALFALGVDLPLENGTRAVKADLLVGADGIPKGIRLVE